ncbi:hypothetical protein DYL61_28070 [Pseudomonas nabeulensis]|uniref:Uncharacterized protein n=1 Tax=Pseudomonas nabeulensis TaxID=2293833 RepID=A0A4Z0AJ71_9PSED|nr:hypothetical protein [Pseudomonas nabeulensis]TFY86239.1 hypothetical protein DYL61_28070 [Pseudomonas nabeulensis]
MDIAGYRFITLLVGVEAVVGVLLLLYVHYFKLEKLERYFEDNEIVQLNKLRWPGNLPMQKALRLGQIACFLAFPKSYIRLGDVSEQEIASVPVSLKRWVLWTGYFWLQIFIWMAVRFFLYEL